MCLVNSVIFKLLKEVFLIRVHAALVSVHVLTMWDCNTRVDLFLVCLNNIPLSRFTGTFLKEFSFVRSFCHPVGVTLSLCGKGIILEKKKVLCIPLRRFYWYRYLKNLVSLVFFLSSHTGWPYIFTWKGILKQGFDTKVYCYTLVVFNLYRCLPVAIPLVHALV